MSRLILLVFNPPHTCFFKMPFNIIPQSARW
jgi:hypothetical protein